MPGANDPPEQEESIIKKLLSQLPRMILIYLFFTYGVGTIKNALKPPEGQTHERPTDDASLIIPQNLNSVWKLGEIMDLYFYIDISPRFNDYMNNDKLLVKETGIKFGDYGDIRSKELTIPCTQVWLE
jgi:hypothetical protein